MHRWGLWTALMEVVTLKPRLHGIVLERVKARGRSWLSQHDNRPAYRDGTPCAFEGCEDTAHFYCSRGRHWTCKAHEYWSVSDNRCGRCRQLDGSLREDERKEDNELP